MYILDYEYVRWKQKGCCRFLAAGCTLVNVFLCLF